MPVSGLPANRALLNTTSGSSGVSMKRLQNVPSVPVVSDDTAAIMRGRSISSTTVVTTQTATSADKAVTAISHRLYPVSGVRTGAAVSTTGRGASGSGTGVGACRG